MSNSLVSHSDVAPQSATTPKDLACRLCGSNLEHVVVDLGLSPLCENLIHPDQLHHPETFYPLQVYVCGECWLVQLRDYVSGIEIFDEEYAYASSMSSSWLEHCRLYSEQIIGRMGLNADSLVIEVASNDGYLLEYFKQRNIPCLGIEPAAKLAAQAKAKGIPVCTEYFSAELASRLCSEGIAADLMIGNNVLAHVPNLHDFLSGFKRCLAPEGVVTFEFQHLLNLIQKNQFDTIYQEHYCYLSLIALKRAFAMNGLRIFDVEELSTHGGSLRIYGCHEEAGIDSQPTVEAMEERERAAGVNSWEFYEAFKGLVSETKWKLLEFLIECRRAGKTVVGYGAPGKGNTLLNYCGIREDLLKFTVDRNPLKQNTFLVGSRIPVYEPGAIDRERPDYILVLPWNIRDEIAEQLRHVRQWGAKFVVPIPHLEIF